MGRRYCFARHLSDRLRGSTNLLFSREMKWPELEAGHSVVEVKNEWNCESTVCTGTAVVFTLNWNPVIL
jgi:hypothetical protein